MKKRFDENSIEDFWEEDEFEEPENWRAYDDFAEEEEYYEEEPEFAEEEEYYEEESEFAEEEEYYEEESEFAEEEEYYEEEPEFAEEEEYYEEEPEFAEEEEYYEEEPEFAEEEEYYEEEPEFVEEEEYYEEESEFAEEEYYEEEPEPVEEYREEEYYEAEPEFVEEEESEGRGWLFYVAVVASVAALFVALFAGFVIVRSKMNAKQVPVFANVGSQLDQIEVIGDAGLLALAQVHKAKEPAAESEPEEQPEQEGPKEYVENEYSKSVTVALKMVSVQKDLKIKFINKSTDKLISNTPFTVTVTTADNKVETWADDDMDGVIYKKNIAPGDYQILVNALAASYSDYTLPVDVQKAEVKKDIAYQKIDVSDEVKKESQIDVATEEQKKQEPVQESSLKDTVEWVASTSEGGDYVEVAKGDIPEPVSASVSMGDIGFAVQEGQEGAVTEGGVTYVPMWSDPKEDDKSLLRDKDGRQIYVVENGDYREAVFADYYKEDMKFYKKANEKYTGWQTVDGKVYYYDESGEKVTGQQVIQGAKYNFTGDGVLMNSSGVLGIDVSKHNGKIDWYAVKNSGVSYVIIRCGYRGYTQGALVEDPNFAQNIKGATAAGLKVGVYFFSQAVDEVEAVAEASFVLEEVKGYTISYPIFLDVEYSGAAGKKGRADKLDKATRTAICKAFCATIQSSGYTAGIYANKTWLEEKIDTSQLGAYKIWVARYAAELDYTGRYEIWQYKATGKVSGIEGDVDLNLSYLD